VSDVTNTGRFSPDTFDAEWLDGASGPSLGARFRGHVKRNEMGAVYGTRHSITAGRSLAWLGAHYRVSHTTAAAAPAARGRAATAPMVELARRPPSPTPRDGAMYAISRRG
jgi:hypothetical protein